MTIKYKGTTFDTGLFYAPYIPIKVVTMSESKVQIKFKDLGEQRWLCWAVVPPDLKHEFISWLNETLNDRVMITHQNREYPPYGNRAPTITYEIRGGNTGDSTLLALRWK